MSGKAVKVDARPLFFMGAFQFVETGGSPKRHRVAGRTTGKGRKTNEGIEASVYRDIPEDLKALIEPVLHELECELVDVVVRRGASQGLVRVVIDNLSGDGRVSIDNIASASREIEVQLDAADFMSGRHHLEVTSPGLDRTLAREKDFQTAVGSRVNLVTRRPISARKRYKGILKGFADGMVRVEVDGRETQIPFEEIEKANTIYQFSRDDFSDGATGHASKSQDRSRSD